MGTRNKAVTLIILICSSTLFAKIQRLDLVTAPTAGILGHRQVLYRVDFSPYGGITGYLNIGLLDKMNLGISYGGDNIISYNEPDFLPHLNFNFRARFLEETVTLPAIAVGFDNQGYLPYYDGRFFYKSPGFYAVASKNYGFLYGDLSFHLGGNYTLETTDKEGPDFFAGFIYIYEFFKLTLDYRAGLDDNLDTEKRGYLNGSVGFLLEDGVEFSLLFVDMMENKGKEISMGRMLRLNILKNF